MILVDTSIWIDHLRKGDDKLSDLLNASQVLIHPFVIGEIALGFLKQRELILETLASLPAAIVARDEEVLKFIGAANLVGRGIGYLDAHLLTSAKLSDVKIWTRDKRLAGVAQSIELAFE